MLCSVGGFAPYHQHLKAGVTVLTVGIRIEVAGRLRLPLGATQAHLDGLNLIDVSVFILVPVSFKVTRSPKSRVLFGTTLPKKFQSCLTSICGRSSSRVAAVNKTTRNLSCYLEQLIKDNKHHMWTRHTRMSLCTQPSRPVQECMHQRHPSSLSTVAVLKACETRDLKTIVPLGEHVNKYNELHCRRYPTHSNHFGM